MFLSEGERSSDIVHDHSQFVFGKDAGRKWAMRAATNQELQRLTDLHTSISFGSGPYDWDDYFDEMSNVQFLSGWNGGRRGWLANVVEPNADIEYFWGDILGFNWESCTEEAQFLKGFCEGALLASDV